MDIKRGGFYYAAPAPVVWSEQGGTLSVLIFRMT